MPSEASRRSFLTRSRLVDRRDDDVGRVDALGEVPQPLPPDAPGDRDLAAHHQELQHLGDVAVVRPAGRGPRHDARVRDVARASAARSCRSSFRMSRRKRVVVADPGRACARGTRQSARRRGTGRGRSSAGSSALCSNSVRSCSRACCRWAGWYAEPRRLQATRSALGAIAAVGSICSRVSCCTTASSSVGRGASSSCARTAMRRACALVSRCTKPLKEVLETELFERPQQEVGFVEREGLGDRVRHRDHEHAGRFGRTDPVDGIFERDRLVRLEPERVERFEVERRLRLRALDVAVCRDDRVPAVHTIEPGQMSRDPLARAARHDRGGEAVALRLGEIVLDARPEDLQIEELVSRARGARSSAGRGRAGCRRAARGARRGRTPRRSSPRASPILRAGARGRARDRGPRRRAWTASRCREETVEVEQEPADCHGVSLPDSHPPKSAIADNVAVSRGFYFSTRGGFQRPVSDRCPNVWSEASRAARQRLPRSPILWP